MYLNIRKLSAVLAIFLTNYALGAYPMQSGTTVEPATVPSLANLSLSVGDLYPTFDSARTVYIATVANDITQLRLNLRAANSSQEITVNGNTVTTSTTLPLSSGDNTITIAVNTADNSATETYTVKVIRISVQNFELVGTWKSTANENVDIQCPFDLIALDPIGSEYDTVKTSSGLFNIIDNDDPSIIYTEISRQRPNRYTFRYMESFNISVEGQQFRGNQNYTITVILISDEQATVVGTGTINLTDYPDIPCNISYITQHQRTDRSSIALKNLSISSGQLNPSFDGKTKRYIVNVDSHVGQLTVIPTANHSGQRITINGTTVSDGIGTTLPLNIGDNTISIAVTSADRKATASYTIVVTRQHNTPPNLANLSLSVGDLYPTFDSARTVYIATVANDITQLRLNLRAANSSQEITVNGNTVTTSTTLPLSPGNNTITIAVNTADNSATETYTVKVIRISVQNFELVGTWKSTANENVDIQCPFDLIALDPIGSEYDTVKTSSGLFNIIDNDDPSIIYTEISRQQPNRYTFRYTESFNISVEGVQFRGNQNYTITAILISDEQATVVGAGTINLTDYPNIPCNVSYITQHQRTDRSSIALKNLSISSGQLNPSFDSEIKHYTVNVDSHVGQLTIIPTANHSGQRITINGTTVSDGIGH